MAGVRALFRLLFWVCALGLTLVFARSFLIQSDEGYTLNAAWQVWTGLRMYDDFRVFVGPGSAYAVLAVWRLVGAPSFLAARLMSVALSFGGTLGLILLLRRLAVRGLVLAVALLVWLWVSALYVLLNHNSFSSFAAIWYLLALVRAVQNRQAGRAAPPDEPLVGVAAGVVFLFLPIKGSLLAACGAAFLFASRPPGQRRPALPAVLAGFAVVIAPLFVLWNPLTLIRQWLVIPLTGNYLGHTSASPVYGWLALGLLAAMAVTASKRRDQVLLALTCTQAAMFLAMLHNLEASHFAINSFPAIVFWARVLHGRAARNAALERFPPAVVLALALAVVLVWTATPAGAWYGKDSVLRADLLRQRPAPVIKPRIAAAHAIYAGPFLPGLYYQLGKKNPFFVSETVVCDDACQRRLVAQLEQVKPEIAILDHQMIDKLHVPDTGPVDVYLRDHYVACPGDGIPVRAISPDWCP